MRAPLPPITSLLVVLALAPLAAGCGGGDDDTDDATDEVASTTVTRQAVPSTTTLPPGFCNDLAEYYEVSGAFLLTVTTGEASTVDLDLLERVAASLPTQAPPDAAADAQVVATSTQTLVTALRTIDLADAASVTPLLLASTEDAALDAGDRLDEYARLECQFSPEDVAGG